VAVSRRRTVAAAAALGLAVAAAWGCGRRGAGPPREFGVDFASPSSPALLGAEALDGEERRLWRVAARAAVSVAGEPPPGTEAVARVRWSPPSRGGDGVLGEARGGVIAVAADADPLKSAFRAGHELAHVLIGLRWGEGALPLWVEEGLAQLAGFRAAEDVGRTLSREARRVPPPEPWPDPAETAARTGYPDNPPAIAAFYWQSAALVRAVHARLGPAVFDEWLAALARGEEWTQPLRERWWFTDADIARILRQAEPNPPPAASASAAWTL